MPRATSLHVFALTFSPPGEESGEEVCSNLCWGATMANRNFVCPLFSVYQHVLSLCSVVVGHFAVALHGDPKISAQCTSKAEGGPWLTWEHRFGSCRWQIGMIG